MPIAAEFAFLAASGGAEFGTAAAFDAMAAAEAASLYGGMEFGTEALFSGASEFGTAGLLGELATNQGILEALGASGAGGVGPAALSKADMAADVLTGGAGAGEAGINAAQVAQQQDKAVELANSGIQQASTMNAPATTGSGYELAGAGPNIPNPAYKLPATNISGEGIKMGSQMPAGGVDMGGAGGVSGAFPTASSQSGFMKGVDDAMAWAKKNPFSAGSMAMNAITLLGGKQKQSQVGEDPYKGGILQNYKMSPNFQGRFANPQDYQYTPKVYNMAEGGIAQIAGGGPIEAMSNANAVGANTGYPMANIQPGAYATPYQQPIPRNVITDSADTGVNPMNGEMRFSGGGKTPKPKEHPDVGIIFDTDPDTRSLDALTAAQIRQAKVNKRANMQLPGIKRPTPMGQLNMVPVTMKANPSAPDMTEAAQGGIMSLGGYAAGGNPRLLKGPGDGMSDNIPATIAGKQPARLADGEFVIPADVVSHLGNGSTEAGAKKLHQMMNNVRKARTGNPKQGKQINPNKFMPK